MSFFVDLGKDKKIRTTSAYERETIKEGIQALISNSKNRKRIIGLDLLQTKGPIFPISVLQLSDADQCLMIYLPSSGDVPVSLTNFLSLPGFTFAGFGIKDALAKLKTNYGLVCKNFLEVRPSELHRSGRYLIPSLSSELLSMYIPTGISNVLGHRSMLTEDGIKLAVSNAVAAFRIGDMLLNFPV